LPLNVPQEAKRRESDFPNVSSYRLRIGHKSVRKAA
jgi:hypothetical protein